MAQIETTGADLLRRAAARIRELAQSAGAGERWEYEPHGEVVVAGTAGRGTETHYVTCDSEGISPAVDETVGPHVALWSPSAADIVASILYAAVERYYSLRRDDIELRTYGLTDEQAQAAMRHEFALARHILGEDVQ